MSKLAEPVGCNTVSHGWIDSIQVLLFKEKSERI